MIHTALMLTPACMAPAHCTLSNHHSPCVQLMWKAALERCACQIEDKFDLSGTCLLSEGHSAAKIDQVLSALTTEHTPSPASPDILYDRRN